MVSVRDGQRQVHDGPDAETKGFVVDRNNKRKTI
jgi:hypothetical protein